MGAKLHFISNNVKGLQNSLKRIKIFEYLKNNLGSNGFLLLQETHSSLADEKKWADDLNGPIFFSHGKTNSCGVATGYIGSNKVDVLDKKMDKNGCILILDVKVDETNFVLVNIYNPNTETEQVATLHDLDKMLETIKDLYDKHIVLAGDFNFFFDTSLDLYGGKPTLKKKSIAKFIELKEKFDLCDIWRIRNPKTKRYTFRQKHVSGLIQRRLDYFYISNSMQVSVKNTDVLASLLTDHSPITFSCFKNEESKRGRGLWKFNNSLIENAEYVLQMKKFILDTLNELFNENILDDQVIWEYLKYNIRKYTIKFCKELAKSTNKITTDLKTKLKHFENHENYVDNIHYQVCKQQLDKIYEKKAKGIKIRSKCNWYEHGEKSTKFFLNLEKYRTIQSQIHSVFINQDEITDQDEIDKQIFSFY